MTRRLWREDRRLRNLTSGFRGSTAIEEENGGVETKARPGGRRNPGDRGAVCPNRGQEECEEPDSGYPRLGTEEEPDSGKQNPLARHASGEAWHHQVRDSDWDRGREDGRKITKEGLEGKGAAQ
ncbi:hypothetical protein NDU88_005950 [Pleurodeles waltl]|uniref:Uncharacterized protein n=1 Tax=Pleurodeles waltl TaxID=8319 RepID=A0AAV7MAV6_PLEWA|nr:hypothetical protein NDU88_005950 [Pleurodeles waltl]